jgi:hypothetical protein
VATEVALESRLEGNLQDNQTKTGKVQLCHLERNHNINGSSAGTLIEPNAFAIVSLVLNHLTVEDAGNYVTFHLCHFTANTILVPFKLA